MSRGFMPWVTGLLEQRLGQIVERPPVGRSRLSRLALNADGTVMAGIIQTGEFGYATQLYNVEAQHVSHDRTTVEAEFIPFFFMMAAPRGSDFGVLLLQRFHNLGVRDYFAEPLVRSFDDQMGNAGGTVTFNRLVPDTLARQLLQDGVVKTVRLVKYGLPENVGDAFGEGYLESAKQVELVIRAKRDGSLPKLPAFMQALTRTRTVGDIVSVPSFEYDTIKLDLEVGGRRRLVNLGRPGTLSPNFDVSNELRIGPDGHPTWGSCVEVFSEHVGNCFADMGLDEQLDYDLVVDNEADGLPTAPDLPQAA